MIIHLREYYCTLKVKVLLLIKMSLDPKVPITHTKYNRTCQCQFKKGSNIVQQYVCMLGFFSLETFFYLTVIFRFQGRWKMRPTQQGTKAHLGNWFLSKGLLPNFGKDQIPPVSWVIFTFSLIQTLKDSTIHIQLRDCFLIHHILIH